MLQLLCIAESVFLAGCAGVHARVREMLGGGRYEKAAKNTADICCRRPIWLRAAELLCVM